MDSVCPIMKHIVDAINRPLLATEHVVFYFRPYYVCDALISELLPGSTLSVLTDT